MTEQLKAKLCYLCKWEDYSGYGFSLRALKGEIGHSIFQIDEYSPAYAGGLRDDDFVVEVNGINVLSKAHKEVVELIREHTDHVSLLVLDPRAREYFSHKDATIEPYQIQRITCPSKNPFSSKVSNGDRISLASSYSTSTVKEITVNENSVQNISFDHKTKSSTLPQISGTMAPGQSSSTSTPTITLIYVDGKKNNVPVNDINNNNQNYYGNSNIISNTNTSSLIQPVETRQDSNSDYGRNTVSSSLSPSIATKNNHNGFQNGSRTLDRNELLSSKDSLDDPSKRNSRRPRHCSISSSFAARAALFNEL